MVPAMLLQPGNLEQIFKVIGASKAVKSKRVSACRVRTGCALSLKFTQIAYRCNMPLHYALLYSEEFNSNITFS